MYIAFLFYKSDNLYKMQLKEFSFIAHKYECF